MKRIIFYLFLLLNAHVSADSKITLVPYISYANYGGVSSDDTNASARQGPVKDDKILGFYSFLGNTEQSIELSLEMKYLNYINNDTLKQTNVVASYKKQLSNNFKINTLVHYISNNTLSDGATIALVGLTYKTDKNFNFTLESTLSLYNSESLANEILQIKPRFSYAYGHKNANWGVLYPAISFYYIKPYSTNTNLQSTYYSTEFKITHKKGAFTTKLLYWLGEQLYAVRDDGFTIYNLNEIHNSGTAVSMHYKLNNYFGIKASYTGEYYTRVGSANEEYMDRALALVDFNF